MKKLFITGYNLDFGGVEKALINLLKMLDPNAYKITLLLQEKKGAFLEEVPSHIVIKEYKLSTSKNPILRKIKNRLHIIFYTLMNYHVYDNAICYATYDVPSSIIAKKVGKKSTLWIHSNYTHIYKNEKELRTFFSSVGMEDFDQMVFVSEEAKRDLTSYYPVLIEKGKVVNNLFDFEDIIEKSKEDVSFIEGVQNIVTVGRLEEKSKAFLRTCQIMNQFKQENKNIHLWIIGDGPDRDMIENYIWDKKIDTIHVLGSKSNPYPYIKNADLFILPSYYEGFPVVCIEALALQKKVVTTIDVTAGSFSLRDYAFLCKQEEESIKETIEFALEAPAQKPFDYVSFDKEIRIETERIIEEGTL